MQIKTFSRDNDGIKKYYDIKNPDHKYTLSWRKTLGL